jgi:hypothetical protein
MTTDWIPGAALALSSSFAAFLASMWRGQLLIDGKLAVLAQKLEDYSSRYTNDAAMLRDTAKEVRETITLMRITSGEQNAAMTVHIQTLKAVADKLESHDMALHDLAARVRVVERDAAK